MRWLLVALVILVPTTAQAQWKEASSERFLVYSEGTEANLRDFTEKLEKFDHLLRTVSNTKAPPPSLKLKVYLMRNYKGVQSTLPYEAGDVAGYYSAGSRGPVAVGARASEIRKHSFAEVVLLHEYTHHFMFHYFPASYPSWYSEGFADYYGQTRILDNDVMELGHPAENRYRSFEDNRWLPLKKLLTARSYSDVPELDLLYAEGWLLVHYLGQNKQRSAQLAKYLNLINAGKSYEEATNEAFGADAAQLDSELRAHSSKVRHEVLVLPFKKIEVKPISIRPLSPAEDALMAQEIALGRGITRMEAASFAADVRRIAVRFPNDPHALAMLVEAERAAGDNAAAAQAVDRLLAVQPSHTRGLMHKGALQMDALKQAGSADSAAWSRARALIVQANKTNPNDPFVLEAYYDSFGKQGLAPNPGAQNALYRAHELVPRDDDLRYKVARDFEQRNMIADAIAVIKPAAFELHSGEKDPAKKKRQEERDEPFREVGKQKRETAREMYERLVRKLPGTASGSAG